jgi:alkylated DNA repair protein (DNA oxidative demethylase)
MRTPVPAPQLDMFAEEPVIAGFVYAGHFITEDEEAELIARIGETDLTPFRFQGWLGKRLTATFGWRYDFDDASFGPAEPMPDWLLPLRDRAAAFAALDPAELTQASINRYDPGAGIGWHRDRAVFDRVVGVSLGAPTVLRFRQRIPGGFRRATAPLAPRSAYLMTGEVRADWEHSVPEQEATRWSVMFRNLSDKGRRRLANP